MNNYLTMYSELKRKQEKEDLTKSEKGKLFELYYALKYNILLYDDISQDIKTKYNLTLHDTGIDLIDFDKNNDDIKEIIQCKNYNGYLSHHDLGTFYYWMQKLNETRQIKNTLAITNTTKFNYVLKNLNMVRIDLNEFDEIKLLPEKQKITYELRDYQIECLNKFHNFNDNIFKCKMPCGTGKTFMFTNYIKQHLNMKFLIIVPLISIAEDIKNYFDFNINCKWTGIDEKVNSNIWLCVQDSLKYYMDIEFDIIIIDEAHHYQTLNYDLPKHKKLMLVSATLDNPDYELSFEYVINNNIINNYYVDINFLSSNEETHDDEFVDIMQYYEYNLIFCNDIDTVKKLVELLPSSKMIIADTLREERIKIINEFQEHKINNIISAYCLTEGVNIPIATNCIFYNDRSSPKNIIQCFGRVLRKHPLKLISHMVLFANCEELAEIKYNKYIKALQQYAHFNKNQIHYYQSNHCEYNQIQIQQYQDKMFEKIVYKNYNDNEKIEICKSWINKFGNTKLPKDKDEYLNFKIGKFIDNLKDIDDKNELKIEIQKLFIPQIKRNRKININKLSDDDKIKLSQEYFDKYHRLPKYGEKYNDWLIGRFIDGIKQGKSKKLKPIIEKIFQCEIKTSRNKIK